MPDLPRFEGRAGAANAHEEGLETANGWRRRGRKVRPGAQPRALYSPGPWDDRTYPMFAVDDLEPVRKQTPA